MEKEGLTKNSHLVERPDILEKIENFDSIQQSNFYLIFEKTLMPKVLKQETGYTQEELTMFFAKEKFPKDFDLDEILDVISRISSKGYRRRGNRKTIKTYFEKTK